MDEAKLLRNIERIKKRIERVKSEQGPEPSATHNYHGGWTLGYWQGRLSALEDVYDVMGGDADA